MTIIKWLSFLWWNLVHATLCYLYVYLTPLPNDCVSFQPSIWFSSVDFISGLVKFIFERSLSGKEGQFLSEVVFAVTFGIYLCNLAILWVLKNWHRFRGMKVQIFPGKNDRVWRLGKDFCGQRGFFVSREGCIFALAIPL